ncbi:MAG: thiol reductant ABC exporter subunit CydC [Ktedonobacteraceae bacterium]|nr:thiol reductant ABC exporter subunit CydC [Ktedonobacteraceae bacterium]
MTHETGTLWRLLRLAWPLKGWIALAALLGVATVGGGIGLMATSAYLISAAALHPSVAALQVAIVGVRFFGIARGVFRYLERYVSHNVSFRLLAQLRVWFYQALEPLAPARLLALSSGKAEMHSSGDLLSRLVSDIETLQNVYVRVIAPPLVAAVIAAGMWLFLGAYHVFFALLWLAFFLLTAIGVPLLAYLLGRKTGERAIAVRARLNRELVEDIQGMADVVAYGREQDRLARMRQLNQELVNLQARMAHIAGLQDALGNLLMNLAALAMLIAAIPLVRAGQLNGVLLAVLALATIASFEAVLSLPSAFQQLGSNLAAARRLFEIVDAQPAVRDSDAPSPVPQSCDLVVKNLRFRYQANEAYVIDNISFALPQGHCLALVGPSGAGKSTLANLLLRFWDYQEGEILLGGHALRDYHQEDIHRLISVVTQHTHLFNTSIRDNILLAKPDASEAELIRAARLAQIHDFIQALPQGYDTQIGEQGLLLSGGERQRIAIARAMLKNAPILLLDEATANLDALTEQAVLQALHTLMQGRTTLIITHRLVGLEKADEILVLQDGRVRERGTHYELMQLEGLYWKMAHTQNQMLRQSIGGTRD